MPRAVGFTLRHSRMVIGAWLAIIALCALVGVGSGNSFTPTNIVAPGTESARWYERLVDDTSFGSNVNVLLSGPRDEMRRQGRAMTARLRDAERARVVSPFEDTARSSSSLRLLHGDDALFVIDVPFDPDEEPAAVMEPVRRSVAATIEPPVTARITGVPAVAEGISDESYAATRKAELLTVPVLILVLLLIFRSPVAAAIPALLGIGTLVAAGGIVRWIATQTTVDQVAMSLTSMVALAVGVDYSLLLVSRYREFRRVDKESVDLNIAAANTATSRTIAFAGFLLIAVMIGSALLAVGPILSSAALGVGAATVFGALSAVFVAPAVLRELDPWLDRCEIPRRRSAGSGRLAHRQPILVPLIALIAILALATPAIGLDTGAPDVKLLPESSQARVDYEKIGETAGPGFGGVFNVLVHSEDGGSLMAPGPLKSITRLQRDLAADPGIAAVLGPAELNRVTRQVPKIERGLTGQDARLARLERGLARSADGARAAGAGADALFAASGETQRGSANLAAGIGDAERGSTTLAEAVGEVSDGSARTAKGSDRLSAGAGRLSARVEDARKASGSISRNAEMLENGLRAGSGQLTALNPPLTTAETALAAVWRALDAMTAGRDDPQFQPALQAARTASEALTGRDPSSGDQMDRGYAGVAAGIADANGQFDLGLYLAKRMHKLGERTRSGVAQLADGAQRVDDGAMRVSAANARLSDGLARLTSSGARLPEGLGELSSGANRLAAGLVQIEAGAGRLAAGMGAPNAPDRLTGGIERMRRAVAEQSDDAQTGALQRNSPRLFELGMLPLAIVDGARPPVRDRAQFVLDLAGSGQTAQISAFPAFATNDPRIDDLRQRVEEMAHRIDRPELEISVGGPGAALEDYKDAATARLPAMVGAFTLITLLILIVALRAVPLATICVAFNLLTVGVTLGAMQLGFGGGPDPVLGGPGYVDVISLGVTLAVVFALSIDYQVFLLARIRQEYTASGDNERALSAAIGSTAAVITGAAAVMVSIFLAFCISSYIGIREIGIGLAIAVFLDATVVRLVLLPAAMRLVGERVWWFPGWLDRRLPNLSL